MLYIFLFFLSFFLTYFIKNYAIKKSLVAQINERSSHTIPTPHGGGVAVVITWFVGLLYLHINNQIDSKLFYALLLGTGISIVSFLDDIMELNPKVRLFFHFLFAIIGLYFLGGLDVINFGLFSLSASYINNLIAVVLIVYYINISNFMDGLNGFIGSEMLFLGITGYALFNDSYFIIFSISILGFLFWNFGNNAKIFLGDVGSTVLGYNIGIFTIYYANIDSLNLWVWFILFGLFLFDGTLTIIRRLLNHENILKAHKKHAYQRLHQSGYSHLQVSLFAIGVNFVLFLIVYFINNIFYALLSTVILLYGIIKIVDSKKGFR